MLAAINPVFRGVVCRSLRRPGHIYSCGKLISVERCSIDGLSGRWRIAAGTARPDELGVCAQTGQPRLSSGCLTIVRAEERTLRARLVDRLAGRDRYRLEWYDETRGHCVVARRGGRGIWILTRSGDMGTRDLFQRVADLRDRGFDTRDLYYANIG
ncbi:MAG: hypothetical protein AAGA61_04185 [Pseudomonadota bacterium]